MPVTANYLNSGSFTIPERIYSIRVRLYGGSGGGEFIRNNAALTSTAGTSGGATTFFGVSAGGGVGGGVGGKNNGGTGGTVTISYNWETEHSVTITKSDGKRGSLNDGGLGGTINSSRRDGGGGTPGIFTYSSFISHSYSPIAKQHYITNSSPDLTVGFPGTEGTSGCFISTATKRYHVGFNIPFVSDFSFNSYTHSQEAAGGSTEGPFYISSGGEPATHRNTLIHTQDYGWLTFHNNSFIANYIGFSYSVYTFWRSTVTYSAGSFVMYETLVYRAKNSNRNRPPEENPDNWELLQESFASLTRPIIVYIGGAGYSTFTNITVKRYSYFDVWHCRAGGSTYVASINFSVSGQKQGAVGRGGGGAAAAEFTVTRQDLIDSVTYAPGTSHDLTVGLKGTRGGSGASDGSNGKVELYQFIIPKVILTAYKTEIIIGESVNLSWYVEGDADSISWESGNLSNANLTSSAVVTPNTTTTYTAVADGVVGRSDQLPNPEASVTIVVYQIPTASIAVPAEINYGDNFTMSYETQYANSSITIKTYYSYVNGFSGVLGEEITINPANSAEEGTDADTVVSSDALEVPVQYNNFGPLSIQVVLEAQGSGGSITVSKTINVLIDQTPDNLNIEETDGRIKDEDPVFAPNTPPEEVVLSDLYYIDGIDIPIEIKSNYPIKVDKNQQGLWEDVRQI